MTLTHYPNLCREFQLYWFWSSDPILWGYKLSTVTWCLYQSLDLKILCYKFMLKDFFECYAQIALFLMIFSLLGHTNFFWNFVFSQQWTHRNTEYYFPCFWCQIDCLILDSNCSGIMILLRSSCNICVTLFLHFCGFFFSNSPEVLNPSGCVIDLFLEAWILLYSSQSRAPCKTFCYVNQVLSLWQVM